MTDKRSKPGAYSKEPLSASEQRFRALVRASSEVVYSMSPDWSEMRWLEGRHFIADIAASSRTWLDTYIFPGDRVEVMQAIEEAVATRSVFELEHRVQREDGSVGWTLSRAVPLLDDDGEIVEWIGMASDITERRQAVEALHRADRRKDEFLAMLSHELRNPLAPIRNAIQLLQLDPDNPAARRRALSALDRQVGTLAQLVSDLLDVSRVTTGHITLHRNDVNFTEIVSESGEAARPLFDQRQQTFTVSVEDTPMWMYADAVRLDQVIANLLVNAAKYTPEGGQVWLSVARAQDEAVVRVVDTGIGFTAELRPHLFELFAQGSRSLDRSQGGLGIGLTLVKRLVELHGGTVSADSTGTGEGSVFQVRLPLTEPPPESADTTHANGEAVHDAAARRVLVVDDNRDAADTMALLLRQKGFETRTVYDGPAVLDAMAEFEPAAVLLDIGLPLIDGYEVARRIRADDDLGDVLLVAMTGYGQPEDVRRAKAAGFDRHMTKPAKLEELEKVLS